MADEKNRFPCWMYHKKHGARLFNTKEELEEAGSGWVDSPAKIKEINEDDNEFRNIKSKSR